MLCEISQFNPSIQALRTSLNGGLERAAAARKKKPRKQTRSKVVNLTLKAYFEQAYKAMKNELEAKNLVQFRLTGTPDGDLLVSFYHLDIFSQEAVNWHIAGLLVENKLNAAVLYEGNLQNNTHHQPAIYKLLDRVNGYVNCVRIERIK